MKELVIKNISIGDELLIGQVINTNAAWLGEHLSEAGFQLDSVLTIGDSERAILDAFDACMDAELVLVTGGLAPLPMILRNRQFASFLIPSWSFVRLHTTMCSLYLSVVAFR